MCMPIARVRVLGFGPGHLTFICEHYRWHPQRQQLFARVHLLNLYIRFGVRCCQTETMLGRSGAQRAYANCCFACCYTATSWGQEGKAVSRSREDTTHSPATSQVIRSSRMCRRERAASACSVLSHAAGVPEWRAGRWSQMLRHQHEDENRISSSSVHLRLRSRKSLRAMERPTEQRPLCSRRERARGRFRERNPFVRPSPIVLTLPANHVFPLPTLTTSSSPLRAKFNFREGATVFRILRQRVFAFPFVR